MSLTLYLPALPTIAASLHVSSGASQASVTLFLLAFGISQVFYGFLSDKHGRKPCILVGMFILIVATILLILFADSYVMFVITRFLQGLGAGASSVLARAIIRDSFPKEKLAGAFALIIMSVSLAPAIASFIGGWLVHFFGWIAIFYFLLIYSIVIALLVMAKLPETLTTNKGNEKSERSIFTTLKELASHSYFLPTVGLIILLYSCQILYLAISPFIFENQLDLSPAAYGTLTMLPASGYLIGNMLTKKFEQRFRCRYLIISGLCLIFIAAAILTLLGLLKIMSIVFTLACLFILTVGVGLAFSNAVALSLRPFTMIAGAAAAISGLLQMSGTSIVNGMINFLHIDTVLGLGLSLLTCSILMSIIFLIIYKRYHGSLSCTVFLL